METNGWKKYLLTFVITFTIFFTAILISNYVGQKKINELRSIQDQISADILSSEVQSSLLEEFSCNELGDTLLSRQLNSLGSKLSYTESNRGSDDEEVVALKKYYSLLQIKDFLLMKRVNDKCGTSNAFILYFYSQDCKECEKQGLVLTKLKEDYPNLRVYSFDYNLDVPAIGTLISINKIKTTLPALLIDTTPYYGFQSIEDIEKAIPILEKWKEEKNSATTTEDIKESE